MKEIASTEFYSIHVDTAKNRMFVTYKGSWMNRDDVSGFVEDHALAMEHLTPGFTVLSDVRPMQAMLITDVLETVQKDSIQAGISRVARIYDRPTFIKRQAEEIQQRTGVKSKAFDNKTDAEAWLDES